MNSKKMLLAIGVSLCTYAHTSAQTIITFDDVIIPEGEISYASALPLPADDSNYYFISNTLKFHGIKASWGGFSGFDCSRNNDTLDGTYLNDRSAITGAGYDGSSQYTVAYLQTKYPEAPTDTYPLGLKLSDSTESYTVEGAYFTNTTWAYKYLLSSGINTYLNLQIYGYHEGMATDSIDFDLVHITETDTFAMKDWTFVDLSALGSVDSIAFRLTSNDPFAPYYFAMDNLQIKPSPTNISNINESIAFEVYPNPSVNYLHLKIAQNENFQYKIYDLHGNTLLNGNGNKTIDVSSLASGQYFIEIRLGNKGVKATRKFIKL